MEELDIKTAIQIAKILAAAPDERIPMILDVFSKAQVDINGLDELAEWRALNKQTALIDTDAFVTELTKDKELEDGEHRNAEPRAWRTVTARIRQKATQWNKHPLGLFYCPNGADLEAKEKAGAMITPAER